MIFSRSRSWWLGVGIQSPPVGFWKICCEGGTRLNSLFWQTYLKNNKWIPKWLFLLLSKRPSWTHRCKEQISPNIYWGKSYKQKNFRIDLTLRILIILQHGVDGHRSSIPSETTVFSREDPGADAERPLPVITPGRWINLF